MSKLGDLRGLAVLQCIKIPITLPQKGLATTRTTYSPS